MTYVRIIRIIAFVSILLTILLLLDLFCSSVIPKNTATKNYWIFSKENTAYDYAFIGPSRVLHTINGEVFDSCGNYKIINLGLSGMAYAEQYMVIYNFLKENKNSLKELFIEVSYYNFIDPDSAFSYPFHEYYYFPYISRNEIYNTIADNNDNYLKSMAWKFIPFIRYAEFNSELRPLVFFRNSYKENSEGTFDRFGTEHLTGSADTLLLQPHFYSNSLMNKKTLSYLDKMILLAKEEKIKVRLFTAPVYGRRIKYSSEAYSNYRDQLKEIIARHSVRYFDFENAPLCSDIRNFQDYTHLNKIGARSFSQLFCLELMNKHD